ncbi:thioesterase II family protein [Actinocrispum wychmicini]|uniref:Surfactin synthase thioesterase subunit n=1 Tax=Actinocrispum wychmicini TaxID=1213861 RepID=A0A4R2JRH8_9PSEU|nr:thioesterase domain-containing protein [Actinocrispum wychmicini]TCO62863.1 surfactin synthase thioesterase subunit [Actinocrispum wychmicini]
MTSAIVEKVSAAGQWFHPAEANPDARVRLLMFPHAGSGAIIYRDWSDLLPDFVSGQAVTLPGRQERRDEAAYTEWDALVDGLYEAVLAELDERPFAFFGHCLGAQLAYQLSVRMADEHLPTPLLMGMSGWAPKGFYTPSEADLNMPEDEVVGWIKRLGSFPAEIYDNPEMLAMVLPALRADLSVSSQRVDHDSLVPCPMISYGGMSDPLREEPDAFESWVPRSPQYLGHREYPGGHFFIDRYAAAVTQDFCDNLYRLEEKARA